jgi:hypothetical protein
MKDIDAQLMVEAYENSVLVNEFGLLPMLGYAFMKEPAATKTAITLLSPLAGAIDVGGKVAGAVGSVGAGGVKVLGLIDSALASIAAIVGPAGLPGLIITGGLVIAALMGTKALIKYLQDRSARKRLDDRINDVDGTFDPTKEILPPEAIKPA